jgi:membrane associated rhomboid family serine protease
MLNEYLIQAYLLLFAIFAFYPDIASPPISYLSTFFLVTNIYLLAITICYLILLRSFEQEIGTNNFGLIYFLGAIAGNLGLISLYFGSEPAIPITGATSGIFAVFGAYIARHPYDLAITEGLPMLSIISFLLLTVGHIIFFGKLDFLPVIVGIVIGYALPASPNSPRGRPMPRRY